MSLIRVCKRAFENKTAMFCSGLVVVLLAFLLPFPNEWNTFMLNWRVEVIAALFVVGFVGYSSMSRTSSSPIGRTEMRFIVVPLAAMAAWSALSMLWASSPNSALQHALTWCLYLFFYLAFREVLGHRGSASLILGCFVGCLSIIAVLAVLAQVTLIFVGSSTPIGIIYSKFGEQAITILPLALIGVVRSNGKRFKVLLTGFALLWLLVFCSSSRASIGLFILALLITGGAILTLRSWRPYRLKFALVCIAIVSLPLSLMGISTFAGTGEMTVISRAKDTNHIQGSNDFRLLMYKLGWEMFVDRPFTGVGANNFGWELNEYRYKYSVANPGDPLLAQAESTVPERAHNEYLQVASELGVVGLAILGWFLIGIGLLVFRLLRNIRTASPLGFAAILGLGMFLASSLVTSYSFRLVQNGITFFFVLAVAAKIFFREKPSLKRTEALPRRMPRLIAVAAAVMLIAICGVRVASEYLTYRGNTISDLGAAEIHYRSAMQLDPKNPDAPYALGRRYIESGRYADAVPLLRTSIDIGRSSSTDFSYLATAYSLAGDDASAEATFSEAAVLYPRSPFVLTRHSLLLEKLGFHREAEAQFARALEIDPAAANTWRALISRGSQYASTLAFETDDHIAVMDLQPYDSIYAIVEERDIRFPNERVKLPFGGFLSR